MFASQENVNQVTLIFHHQYQVFLFDIVSCQANLGSGLALLSLANTRLHLIYALYAIQINCDPSSPGDFLYGRILELEGLFYHYSMENIAAV